MLGGSRSDSAHEILCDRKGFALGLRRKTTLLVKRSPLVLQVETSWMLVRLFLSFDYFSGYNYPRGGCLDESSRHSSSVAYSEQIVNLSF